MEGSGGWGEIAVSFLEENAAGELFEKRLAKSLALKEFYRMPAGYTLHRGSGMLETDSPANLIYRDVDYPYTNQQSRSGSLPVVGLYIASHSGGLVFYPVKRSRVGCHFIKGAVNGKNLVLKPGKLPERAGFLVKVRVAALYMGD